MQRTQSRTEECRRCVVLLRVKRMTSRPTVLASIVLTLALLGDSLLYAILPLHASTFGISLAWAGLLLSANRIVRLFVYPVLPRLASSGFKRFTIIAAAAGAISTLAFAAASGPVVLMASRLAWGAVFGSLSLSTLAYATASNHAGGQRIGLSLSLRELGPILSLTLGTALVTAIGARPTLTALGIMSLAGILVATRLPELRFDNANGGSRRFRLPRNSEWLSFLAGFVTDGIFPATIGLLLARSAGVGEAVAGAGALLALKRVAVVILAPASGYAADRFGGDIATAAGFGITAIGAVSIAFDSVIGGAILLSCGAALTATSIPASVMTRGARDRVAALAGIAMARDAGAAAGPLIVLVLFEHIPSIIDVPVPARWR